MSYVRVPENMVPHVQKFLENNTGQNAKRSGKLPYEWKDMPESPGDTAKTLVTTTHYMFKVYAFLEGFQAGMEQMQKFQTAQEPTPDQAKS